VREGGRDTALQADISPTQDKLSKTINIKAAKAKGSSTTGGVDWANGIVMMLTHVSKPVKNPPFHEKRRVVVLGQPFALFFAVMYSV
jgi:hypothetical protein